MASMGSIVWWYCYIWWWQSKCNAFYCVVPASIAYANNLDICLLIVLLGKVSLSKQLLTCLAFVYSYSHSIYGLQHVYAPIISWQYCIVHVCIALYCTLYLVYSTIVVVYWELQWWWCAVPQGREEGAVIEDWEDPDLSLYKSTDRYGFMQWVHITHTHTCTGVYKYSSIIIIISI